MSCPEEAVLEERIRRYSIMLSDEKGNGDRSRDARVRQQYLHGKIEGLREALEIIRKGAVA